LKERVASKRRKSVEDKLEALDEVSACDKAERTRRLHAALEDRHCRVVAKAASLTAVSLLYDLVPALVTAFSRFVDGGPKQDPSCLAKKAIARALVELDCDDVDFFLAGLRCRQLERPTATLKEWRPICAHAAVLPARE